MKAAMTAMLLMNIFFEKNRMFICVPSLIIQRPRKPLFDVNVIRTERVSRSV